jgi:hypothetical protein
VGQTAGIDSGWQAEGLAHLVSGAAPCQPTYPGDKTDFINGLILQKKKKSILIFQSGLI